MEVRDNSGRNPLIIISEDEVLAWLRQKADEAGYGDRETCAVQINVSQPFGNGLTHHLECPSLVLMVSNIKGSRDVGQSPRTP